MPLHLDPRNTNSLWCSVLVETLVRLGVRQAVCSPGSRSTPLTLALVAHPSVEAIPVLDERSAGFFALGLAKRTGRAVVLVCTSGSAAANYLPAVVEAAESGVPLLVLTADRPPEMRACSSGQTIDQQKLFGGYVKFFHELAVPEATDERLRYLRQRIVHSVTLAESVPSGPVHLNCPFRDPLVPTEDPVVLSAWQGRPGEEFFAHLATEAVAQTPAQAVLRWPTERGVIVAGNYQPADDQAYLRSLAALAKGLRWPILAETLSPARRLALDPDVVVVTAYDSILRHTRTARELVPAHVLCLGQWPTSKVLRAWIEGLSVEVTLVAPGEVNRDALHARTRQVPLRPEEMVAGAGATRSGSYADAWARAEARVREYLDAGLERTEALFEPKALWLLGKSLPATTTVMVANSMPVRDSEYVWPRRPDGPRVFCNRGANGIDGNLSTALGLAHRGQPVYFVCGDLAFLHDSNALLLRPQLVGSLTVVLINNRGGGIFEHLPIARFDPPFEAYFATPQEADFALLCQAHGVIHERVSDWSTFVAHLRATPPPGLRVLELRTDRRHDAAARKALFAEAAEKLSEDAVNVSSS